MKRVFILVCLMFFLIPSALAGDDLYIANPNPADRLHLRAEPYEGAKSLGKYYNGAPIERTGFFNSFGWVEVAIGLGNNRSGYMKADFLSSEKQKSAMPQYAAVKPVKAYQQPDEFNLTLTIAGGRLVSLMGFSDGWWHVLVHTGTSEGDYTCFVPANTPGLVSLADGAAVNAHVSNPDKTDRLHLRAKPSQNSRSLGKYYNGSVGTLKGFTENGEWLKVELYGRTGYMLSKFITIEGKTNRTYYGMPSIKTIRKTRLYKNEDLSGAYRTLPANTGLEVLGLVDQERLHVLIEGMSGYVLWKDTNFVDPK